MKAMEIKVVGNIETSYEDNTSWISYYLEKGTSYEIVEGTGDVALENFHKIDCDKLTDKIDLKKCCSLMQEIIGECIGSENDMWFVEEDDIEDMNISASDIKVLEEEVLELGLEEYITFNECDIPVTVYGGAITKFVC